MDPANQTKVIGHANGGFYKSNGNTFSLERKTPPGGNVNNVQQHLCELKRNHI